VGGAGIGLILSSKSFNLKRELIRSNKRLAALGHDEPTVDDPILSITEPVVQPQGEPVVETVPSEPSVKAEALPPPPDVIEIPKKQDDPLIVLLRLDVGSRFYVKNDQIVLKDDEYVQYGDEDDKRWIHIFKTIDDDDDMIQYSIPYADVIGVIRSSVLAANMENYNASNS
jgi:hypothetical protein